MASKTVITPILGLFGSLVFEKVRTNMGKQAIGYAACVIWDEIPLKLKELSVYQFSKQLKPYLLSEQHN